MPMAYFSGVDCVVSRETFFKVKSLKYEIQSKIKLCTLHFVLYTLIIFPYRLTTPKHHLEKRR
jgi:hypothetical protein